LERCKYCQDTYKASAEKEICLTHTKEVRLIISIDGMTCAACSSSVTRALSEIKGVKDVSVDLMGKSAAVIAEEGLADDVVGAIEDCGFEANVIQTEDLNTLPGDSATRTVHLRIDGMFCQ
jgi:copper chaperone CopZ